MPKFNSAKFGMLCVSTFWIVLLAVVSCGQILHAQVQLLSDSEMRHIRSVLPEVADAEIADMIEDRERTVWYNSRVMPAFYRDGNRFVDVNYNVSGDAGERRKPHGQGGNPNVDFPWQLTPGGTHRSQVTDFKAFRLPRQRGGGVAPITVNRGNWAFPDGTEFLEVVMLKGPTRRYVFDIRMRFLDRTQSPVGLGIRIARPFPRSIDLADAIKSLRPHWRQDTTLVRAVATLEAEFPLYEGRLRNAHPRRLFDVSAGVDVLPYLPADVVHDLLTKTPFESAEGEVWREGTNGVTAFAPTVESGFSIVPVNFDGTFLGTTAESCMNCHKDILMSARVIEPRRGWYDRVRGNGPRLKVFSWHPQDPRNRNKLRAEFLDAGIIVRR